MNERAGKEITSAVRLPFTCFKSGARVCEQEKEKHTCLYFANDVIAVPFLIFTRITQIHCCLIVPDDVSISEAHSSPMLASRANSSKSATPSPVAPSSRRGTGSISSQEWQNDDDIDRLVAMHHQTRSSLSSLGVSILWTVCLLKYQIQKLLMSTFLRKTPGGHLECSVY